MSSRYINIGSKRERNNKSLLSLHTCTYYMYVFVCIVCMLYVCIVCRHRLTYSHSWCLPHECIRIHVNVFVFFLFLKLKKKKLIFFASEWTLLLVHVAYTLTSLYILFSARKLGVRLKTVISIIILNLTVLLFLACIFDSSCSMLILHPILRLQTQGFTKTLSLATTLMY